MNTKISFVILFCFYNGFSHAQSVSETRAFCSMLEEDFHRIKVKCAGMSNEESCIQTNTFEVFRIHKKTWKNMIGSELKNGAKNFATTEEKLLTTMFVNLNDKCEANGYSSLNNLVFQNSLEKSLYLYYNGYVISPSSNASESSNTSNKPKNLNPNGEWESMGNGFEVNRRTNATRVQRN